MNASGTVSASQLYGPYGAVRYQNGTLPTDYAFTHQRADATSGLDYYNARYYDPLAGQFTSADTASAGGLNRYGYVGGNPETKSDPTGHCPWCIAGAIIGAVVGAGIVYGVQVYNNYQSGASNPLVDNIDWGAVGMGALAGAFIGGTMGAGATAAAGVFAAGGSVGTAASAGAGAAAVYAGYGIAPTVGGGVATSELNPLIESLDDPEAEAKIAEARRLAMENRKLTGGSDVRPSATIMQRGTQQVQAVSGPPQTDDLYGSTTCGEGGCLINARRDGWTADDSNEPINMYMWHRNGRMPCAACQSQAQLAANTYRVPVSVNFYYSEGGDDLMNYYKMTFRPGIPR
ncbi:MAG TPA: RHS repeat-associated core domain-containing protein [Ktedonobacterales bacterium]